ncbi:MAG: peptide/nickel transport system substrate-binding protein [Chloroflexota bacterium]|nr:peptide/nickel transport system substrate-binding protein [Chloroflexota bacterium]
MRKVVLTVLSLVTVASFVMVGCASTATEAPAAAADTAMEDTAPAAAEPVMEEAAPATVDFPREETLYTMGKQWGPATSWNPLQQGAYATGTIGLCYETLFIYNPLTDEYIPWIADSGEWVDDTTYQLKIKEGVTFSDGEALTADDVIFTLELGKNFKSAFYSELWAWLDSVEKVDDYTITMKFTNPLYQEWANYLYTIAILPQHLWEGLSEEEAVTGANQPPVGSGPYMYDSADEAKVAWVRDDNWWGISGLGLEMAPKYIVDIVNINNNAALGMVLQGQVDLNNNYLPGIASIINGGYNITTFYSEPPYMLSANTAWLVMNLIKAPMDDPEFRRAVAYAVKVDDIVTKDYGDIVLPANSSGLLPIWDQFVDQDVVDELGFSYDPEESKAILAAAGYKDVNGDGFVEAPDGSAIALEIGCPNGWSDWMVAIQIISQNLKDVGINVEPVYPDYSALIAGLYSGDFDMVINNDAQMSNTVWSYYHFLFYHPIKEQMISGTGNYGRYENQEAFDLVDQLDATPITDIEGMKAIISQLQRIQLTDMPIIPLWYNGVWAQTLNTYWTNWPSAAEGAPKYVPATWNGYWNMGAVLMLTELEPVTAE